MRSASVISSQRQPHRWHTWLEGKNRSTLTTVPPTAVTLLVSNVSRRPSAASAKERASLRFCISFPLRLEFGIAPLLACLKPFKEIFEGGRHVHEGPFYDRLRDIIGPGELLLTDNVELLLEGFCMWFPTSFIVLFPLGKSPIETEPCGPSGFRKVLGLLRRWVQPDLVCLDHPCSSKAARLWLALHPC